MEIVCISIVDNGDRWWKYITTGRKYKCIDVIGYYPNEELSDIKYKIIDDSGVENIYPSKNFIADWEIRERKFKELGI